MRLRIASLGGAILLSGSAAFAQPVPAPPPPVAPAPAAPAPGLQPAPYPGAPQPLAPGWQGWPGWQAGYMAPPPRFRSNEMRSNGMRIAGIVLTSLASAMVVAGAVVTSLDLGSRPGEWRGLFTLLVGVPLFGTSTILAGIGIPLWVVGASPAKVAVSAGPGGLRLTF